MKKIELSRRIFALVDDDLFGLLNQFPWHSSRKNSSYNYATRNIKTKGVCKPILMHRQVIELKIGRPLQSKEIVDHINHNSLDNRMKNLRIVSHRQNLQNQKRSTSSQYAGVSWDNYSKRWRARIRINGKLEHLGLFEEERDAAKAYERACRELIGEELICKI